MSRLWLVTSVLVVIYASSSLAADRDESVPGKAWIRGKITIGPLCPGPSYVGSSVVRPCESPEAIARALQERKVILYSIMKIAEVLVDENGEYALPVRPGKYILDVSDSEGRALPFATRASVGNVWIQECDVAAGETSTRNFSIDTGIR